jgi:transposase-like protein
MGFPAQHRRTLHSTNGLERPVREVKGRTNVVDIFRNESRSSTSSARSLLKQNGEWGVQPHRSIPLEASRRSPHPGTRLPRCGWDPRSQTQAEIR